MIAQRRPRAQTSQRRISGGPHPHELTLCENEHGAAGINAVAALTEATGVELIVFGARVRHPGTAVPALTGS